MLCSYVRHNNTQNTLTPETPKTISKHTIQGMPYFTYLIFIHIMPIRFSISFPDFYTGRLSFQLPVIVVSYIIVILDGDTN